MAYRKSVIPMTLSDLQGHSPTVCFNHVHNHGVTHGIRIFRPLDGSAFLNRGPVVPHCAPPPNVPRGIHRGGGAQSRPELDSPDSLLYSNQLNLRT